MPRAPRPCQCLDAEFYCVHWLVKQANPDAALGDIQIEALDTVRDLVSAGLYESGRSISTTTANKAPGTTAPGLTSPTGGANR
ncbi:hypothetical protein DSM43276_01574 [Mycobacteroides salmoniphilum]|nr:hypothetical protein DSM43276_01574 [Mycobacteroides salmoniphilum]